MKKVVVVGRKEFDEEAAGKQKKEGLVHMIWLKPLL